MNTYNFIAECLIDAYSLLTSIQTSSYNIKSSDSLDCYVTITTNLSRKLLLKKIEEVSDGHVMARTLNKEIFKKEQNFLFPETDPTLDGLRDWKNSCAVAHINYINNKKI